MMDYSNDTILVDQLKKGNHQALTFLMNTYHTPLCLYAYSLSNDYENAKDIVQNVFIKIWEDKHKFDDIKSMKNFLYKSVYNKFVDQWRKDKKMLFIEEKHIEAIEEIVTNQDDELLKKQMLLIKKEIETLPAKCKETFLLSKKNGLTNIEIADFMNVSIRTVETQMSKAYKILREKLKHKITPVLFLLFGFDLNQPINSGELTTENYFFD